MKLETLQNWVSLFFFSRPLFLTATGGFFSAFRLSNKSLGSNTQRERGCREGGYKIFSFRFLSARKTQQRLHRGLRLIEHQFLPCKRSNLLLWWRCRDAARLHRHRRRRRRSPRTNRPLAHQPLQDIPVDSLPLRRRSDDAHRKGLESGRRDGRHAR